MANLRTGDLLENKENGRTARNEAKGTEDRQSLNVLIKESNNADAAKIKEDIDNVRKDRNKLISKVKDLRRRLMYKEAEGAAIEKLLKMKKETEKDQEKKGIGYLKRMKARLEFKISTEASSLSQEKEIIRRINEINRELDEALASVRMERKAGFIVKDIEEFGKGIKGINDEITALDTRLDGLYANLRKMLGILSAKQRREKMIRPRRPPVHNDINLEDIAIIKKK